MIEDGGRMKNTRPLALDSKLAAVLPRRRQLFYGGRWHEPLSGRYTESLNPATQETLGPVADANAEDVDRAVQAAHQAFQSYRKTPPLQRAKMLREAAAIVRANAEELALIDAADCGNPVKEMVHDA